MVAIMIPRLVLPKVPEVTCMSPLMRKATDSLEKHRVDTQRIFEL